MIRSALHRVIALRATAASRSVKAECAVLAGEVNAVAEKKGISLPQAATGRSIWAYALGTRRMSYETANAIASVSGLSIDALMRGSDSAAA